MLKTTTLRIPNDISYIDIVFNYVEPILERLKFNDQDKYLIKLSVEESLINIIQYAFEPDDIQDIDITCELVSNSLVISLKDKGLPFDPSLIPEYKPKKALKEDTTSGLSTYLMKQSMDEVNYINLGRQGNEIQLIKHLPYKNITQYGDFEKEKADEKTDEITEDKLEEIRTIKPEEAVEVSKCVYISYGYTYVNEDVYFPNRVKNLNKDKTMTSALAISEQGTIAGHVAIFKPSKKAKITEWGMAVVKHQFRGQGIMNKLVTFIIKKAQENNFNAIFAHCVTEHPYTQKICHKFDFSDTAIALAYSPASVQYKKMVETLSQRQTIVFCFKYFNNPKSIKLCLPEKHKKAIKDIYQDLGVEVQKLIPKNTNQDQEKSKINTEIKPARSIGLITIEKVGEDLIKSLSLELKRLCIEQTDVIYLNLNLEDPMICEHFKKIEKLGFFFSGLLPGHPFEHTLILQYLNNIKIDYDKIELDSEKTKNLLSYIKKQDPNET